jgi:hypothetical protein
MDWFALHRDLLKNISEKVRSIILTVPSSLTTMEEAFYTKLNAYVKSLSTKKQTKYLIKTETYYQLIDILNGTGSKCPAQFKFWAKKRFYIVKIGGQEILYSSKEKLSVVTFDNLFDKINECHVAVGHLGRDKTWHEVRRN